MNRVVIIPNVFKDTDYSVTYAVIEKLLSLKMKVYIEDVIVEDGCKYRDMSKINIYDRSNFPKKADLVISIGGDGSVLQASEFAVRNDIPILGVNLGKIGYLAEVEPANLDVLDNLINENYYIDEKMLLMLDIEGRDKLKEIFAVNDVVILREDNFGVANIKVEDSLANVVKYRSDGLVMSTPQGSTAYSLSAGGPILAHDVETILMTPISPHSFFNRSVLFNSSDVIRITNVGEIPLNINMDGRFRGNLMSGDYCDIKKAPKKLKMLTFCKNSMFSNLFKKMRILGEIE